MEAVDLVHLNTESPGLPTLEVDQFMLNEILTNAKEGNAIVISIVGPLQSGKSFLMNLLIKNLQFAQQESDQDWLYQGGPLRGFRFEASSGVVTRGISVYRQPFKIKGRPVFVIDTRGVFEEETCLREWAGIVGTCLAISSCTIFNVQTLLHDDSLNYLDTFIQYSRILCSNVSRGDDEIKIENLMFLVRDWNNPSEFQYGAAGGQQFLMKKFSTDAAGMTEEAKRVRKSILASVRNISCFLMAHPGSSLSTVQYNQPIQPGSLVELHESSMREFMSTLARTDSIWNSPPSPIHRIAEFVQVFNSVLSQVLPTVDITAQVNYEMNIYSGVKFYEATIGRKIEKKGRIRLRYVDEHHSPLKSMLLDRFRRRRHYGNAEMQEQCILRLDQALESARVRIIEELVKQQEALAQQAKSEAISTACEQLKDLSVSETLSPSALEKAWNKAKAAALSTHEKLLEKIEKEKRGGLQGNLEAALLEIYEGSREKCQQRQQLLIDGHQEILKESVGRYEERMEIISVNYVPEAKFLKTHDVAMAFALKYFTNHIKISPEVKQVVEANFIQLIEQAKANFLKLNENIFEEFNTKKQQILEKTLATFSEKVSEILEQQEGLPQKLGQIKDERNEITEKALEDVEQLEEATPPLVLAFKKELKAKLDEKVQDAKAEMDQKTVEQAEFAKKFIQDAIDNFHQTVKILTQKIINPGFCSQALQTAKEYIIQNVSTSLSEIYIPNLQFYLNHLNNQVDILLTQALKENNGKHQVMMETLKNILEYSLKEFKDAADGIISKVALGDTNAPSRLLKAEDQAVESFDSAVADCHFPHSETDLAREELHRALENSRESYLGRLEDRTVKNSNEIVFELYEKSLKALVEKMDFYCRGQTFVSEADFNDQWEKSKSHVVLVVEIELLRSNRMPPHVSLDIMDKVKQLLGSAEEAWQKHAKVNDANRRKHVESMDEFVAKFEERSKEVIMGAAKYSYKMCNDTSETENVSQRPTKDSNSNETSTLAASSSYHLAPFPVATNSVGTGSRLLRHMKPSSNTEPPRTSTDNNQDNRFYERVLLEEYKGLSEFVGKILPASDNPREDLIEIYKSQINYLHQVVKHLESELASFKLTTSMERTDLVSRHEEMVEQIIKEHEVEIASLKQQHWELVDEIIRSHIDQIELWKLEFVSDCEKQGDSQAVVPTKNQKLAAELMNKYKELNTAKQGLVVVGMGVVAMAVGYYSWPFMNWAWPRLTAFAARIEVASVAGWLFKMMDSTAFKDFMKAWEDGKPLGPAFFKSFGREIISAILSMAPKLFQMGRTALVGATAH